jgi:pimeloyl-ACP methyl ester carboxylesterase
MPVGPPLLDAAADNHHAAIDMANTWSHSAQGRMGAGQVPGLSNLISGERWLERMHDGVYHADLAACNAFTAQLDLGDIPTLVIIGEVDQMTPAKFGNRVAGALRNAQTVTLKNCGHAMLSEQPNQVLDALKEFI